MQSGSTGWTRLAVMALLCQSYYAVFVGVIAKSYVTMLLLTVGSTGSLHTL